jgi:iron(II)-dependent oxidoreductase
MIETRAVRPDEHATTRAALAAELQSVREATLRLFDIVLVESDLHESPGFGFRPLIWHLAHTGVFESYWILQKVKGDPAPDERYERVFDPIATPREQSKDLPARREMEAYLADVRRRVLDFLAAAPLDADDPLLGDAYVFRLVLEHERQHQETLAYLLHLLDPAKKARPAAQIIDDGSADPSSSETTAPRDAPPAAPSATAEHGETGEMILVPAGEFRMGAEWGVFAYDNELPAHDLFVPAFRLARTPVTNGEFARFVAEGGYRRREFWDEEGWPWREREGWESPLYWRRDGGAWLLRGMFGEGELPPDHPVTGVSWYEAEAYARFAGRRLPTEPEWEKAASWDAARGHKTLYAWGDRAPSDALCNFDLRRWGTAPVAAFPAGASPAGCLDMNGNAWEWTSSKFAGYPNFRAFPYPEYSEVWFDEDHRVLKGGSWATSAPVLRTSFRNFFRRHFRIAFAGLRLAAAE